MSGGAGGPIMNVPDGGGAGGDTMEGPTGATVGPGPTGLEGQVVQYWTFLQSLLHWG